MMETTGTMPAHEEFGLLGCELAALAASLAALVALA